VDVPGVAKGEGGALVDLPALRGVDALVHVVRAFESDTAPHPDGSVDPLRDAKMLELELILADLGTVERRLERLEANIKKAGKPEDVVEREDVTALDGDAGELCPPAPDPVIPELRLRTLTMVAPTAMTNVVLQQLIGISLEDELFIWLLRVTGTGTGAITLRTGGGQRVAGTGCTYRFLSPDYPPDELALTETGLDFAASADAIALLTVPIWAEGTAYPDPPWMILPLRELTLGGTFSADHLYVGSYDAALEEWTDDGTVLAKINWSAGAYTLPCLTCHAGLGASMLADNTGAVRAPNDRCASAPQCAASEHVD
jgi:hypothetical protein